MKTITKKLLLILVLFLSLGSVYSQTGIYRTYEDYVKSNLEVMDNDHIYRAVNTFASHMEFKTTQGNKIKLKMTDFWGFLYKGNLFRTLSGAKELNNIVYVSVKGKINFYTDGTVKYMRLKKGEDNIKFDAYRNGIGAGEELNGHDHYISADLQSPLIPLPYTQSRKHNLKKLYKPFDKFVEEHPEYQKFYNCIENDVHTNAAAEICAKNFNASIK